MFETPSNTRKLLNGSTFFTNKKSVKNLDINQKPMKSVGSNSHKLDIKRKSTCVEKKQSPSVLLPDKLRESKLLSSKPAKKEVNNINVKEFEKKPCNDAFTKHSRQLSQIEKN